MVVNSAPQTRLCPYCANSIAEDAANCPYCKVDFSSQSAPKWLNRADPSPEPRPSADPKRSAIPAKYIWMGAMLIIALSAFFAGGYMQGSEQSLSSQANLKQLQAKEQIIQNQETQLTQTRQQLNENSNQLAEMKTKLDENRKELLLTQQRLKVAARQPDRPNTNRSPAISRTASRAPDAPATVPQPAARRTAATGVYETTRPTSVHEDPSSSSRVIAQIDKGTRINVASSAGGWLEVRSKHGNPPGYVRSDDARPGGGVN
jgi:hypothetical protein